MAIGIGVSGCVPPRGVVTATDVTALKADPQVQPRSSGLQALFTTGY